MDERTARKLGYEINRGSYSGATDNRMDRWYVERIDSCVVDRIGDGFRTKREALEHVALLVLSYPDMR